MQTDTATARLVAQTRAHRDSHDSLIEACGSSWLLKLLKTLNDHAERYRMLNVTQGMGDALDDHAALGAAAVSRHPYVVELLWSHRSGYLEALAQRLQEEDESATRVA